MKRVVGPGFQKQVFDKVREVPKGSVTTYGDVAGALGSRSVARHVGFAMANADDDVPWWRVINSQGKISFRGDDGRGDLQEQLLRQEGHDFTPGGKVIAFADVRFAFAAPVEL